MTDTPNPFAAYQSPAVPAELDATPVSCQGRVKAICVVAIVLGALGLGSAMLGCAGMLLGNAVRSAFTPSGPPGAAQDVADLQTRMQNQLQAVQDRFKVVQLVLLGVHLTVAGALLAGGIRGLRRDRRSRELVLIACGAAVAFEVTRSLIQAIAMVQSLSVLALLREEVARGAEAGRASMILNMTQWFAILGAVFGAALVLAKIGFYVFSIRTLRRADVRGYFEGVQVLS